MRVPVFLVVLAAACGTPAPPDVPPAYTDPPSVATDGFVIAVTGAVIDMPPPRLRDYLEANPITDHLRPRGSIAAPVGIEMLRGEWPQPGSTRRVELADGHYVVERVVTNESTLFRYQIYRFTSGAGRGVDQVVGEMRFEPTPDGGTDWRWSYNIKPKSLFARPFIARFRDRELLPYLEEGAASFAAAANQAAGAEADGA